MPTKEIKPLSGFRDMLPEQMIPRQEMLNIIKGVYESYGFTPLDTPALERYETLTGKYGEEGEKLMYKFTDQGGRMLAMRYDLTVPLARVVAQHQNELTMPYKRYQVGNVWRGESPQAGRFREFMQFDADTVGTNSVMADAEIIAMMSDAMNALGADAVVRVNNRRILDALAEASGVDDVEKARALITIIDKVEKIGADTAIAEISEKFSGKTADLVKKYLSLTGSTMDRVRQIESLLGKFNSGSEGVENLMSVFKILEKSGFNEESVVFDQTIARGLNYYTGIIYETTLKELPKIGSVCSGGRYDNLVESLGGPDLPAVGTSIGVDRLFEALRQINKVETSKTTSQVMIANFSQDNLPDYMKIATELRRKGLGVEIYFESDKLGKQFKQAAKLGVQYMILMGPDELINGLVTIKNLNSGQQSSVPVESILELLSLT